MPTRRSYTAGTNVISESIKAEPNPTVTVWLSEHAHSLYLTSITVQELRFGKLMMKKGKRRKAIGKWIDSLVDQFSNSILSYDAAAAEACATFHEQAIATGHTPSIEDLMIAGIAKVHEAVLVTRNVKDFEYIDVEIINPFEVEA